MYVDDDAIIRSEPFLTKVLHIAPVTAGIRIEVHQVLDRFMWCAKDVEDDGINYYTESDKAFRDPYTALGNGITNTTDVFYQGE